MANKYEEIIKESKFKEVIKERINRPCLYPDISKHIMMPDGDDEAVREYFKNKLDDNRPDD